jgi:hypothetical protein
MLVESVRGRLPLDDACLNGLREIEMLRIQIR